MRQPENLRGQGSNPRVQIPHVQKGSANRPGCGSNSQKNPGPLSRSDAPSIVHQNLGSLLPITGLITSGPVTSGSLNASGAPKKPFPGPIDSNGSPTHHKSSHHPINNIGLQTLAVKRRFPTIILWTVVPLSIMGFVAGWNLCLADRSPMSFLAAYEDAHLSNAKDGQFVKMTGIVTCESVPLDSSYQRVTRCVYSSTGLYEYRGLKSKPAKVGHRHFTWECGTWRALMKAGYGAPVMPHVREVTHVDVSGKNKELPADFVRWMDSKNLSCDDRVICLKEGYIQEGNTVTMVGVVHRQENVLMIVPPPQQAVNGKSCFSQGRSGALLLHVTRVAMWMV